MRHRKFTFKIGRSGAHRKAMLGNMVCSLFREKRIRTTVTKAKQARRLAERMITLGKRGRDHDRRRAASILRQPDVVATLFNEIAPRYQDRQGGYTRMMKLGPRTGDAAEMCLLELVTEPVTPKVKKSERTEEAAVAEAAAEASTPETGEGVEDGAVEEEGAEEEAVPEATAEEEAVAEEAPPAEASPEKAAGDEETKEEKE